MKRCSTRGTAYAGSGIDCDEQYNYFRMGSASYRRRRRWIYTRTGWRKHWTVPRTCTIFYTGCTERTTLRRPRCFTAGDFVLRVKLRNARTCSAEQSPPTHTHTLGATAHVCQKFYDVKILKNKETSPNKLVGKYALLYTKIDSGIAWQKLNRTRSFVLSFWSCGWAPQICSNRPSHLLNRPWKRPWLCC